MKKLTFTQFQSLPRFYSYKLVDLVVNGQFCPLFNPKWLTRVPKMGQNYKNKRIRYFHPTSVVKWPPCRFCWSKIVIFPPFNPLNLLRGQSWAKISHWGVFFQKSVSRVVLSNHYGYQIHEKYKVVSFSQKSLPYLPD